MLQAAALHCAVVRLARYQDSNPLVVRKLTQATVAQRARFEGSAAFDCGRRLTGVDDQNHLAGIYGTPPITEIIARDRGCQQRRVEDPIGALPDVLGE